MPLETLGGGSVALASSSTAGGSTLGFLGGRPLRFGAAAGSGRFADVIVGIGEAGGAVRADLRCPGSLLLGERDSR